jgi:hypothetical protein
MPWWILLAAVVVSVAISFLLRPKIKAAKPEAVTDLEDPTAEAGRPIPVAFGTITVKGLNVLWFGDKTHRTYKVKA